MTRKHFQALADALKNTRPTLAWNGSRQFQWELDVKAIARVCKQDNPNFKPGRFFAACGGLFDNPLPESPIEAMAQTDTE